MFIKRLSLSIISILFVTMISVSCSAKLQASDIDESKLNTINGITMKCEKETYKTDVKAINITIKNNSNKEYTFGEYFTVEIYENSGWKTIPFKKDTAFIEIGYLIKPNGTFDMKANLTLLDFKMKAGKYRIVKDIDAYKVTAEFNVK